MRKALKRRFPRFARSARTVLSPVNRLRFRLQDKPDRRVLEDVIFPALLADASMQRVLFVGCAWFTRGYEAIFGDREFWTIDVDEQVTKYAGTRHIVGSITALSPHFLPGSLDVIICNGVVGWGLDEPSDCDQAFRECHACLRPGGLLVVGWNDHEAVMPFSLDELPSLRSFAPHVLPPFNSSRYPTFSPLRHTFDFYVRPAHENGSGRGERRPS